MSMPIEATPANRIHPTVQAMQATCRRSIGDHVVGVAKSAKLPRRDDSVLAIGELSQTLMPSFRSSLLGHMPISDERSEGLPPGQNGLS